MQAIDLDARRLTVDTVGVRSEVAYDSLILAAGAQQSYFGRPDFGWDAPGMKTIDDALELRGRIFGAFEMAEREPDPSLRQIWRTFVVVGAGPTGVELAGQIAELTRRSLNRNFRRIDRAQSRIVLLDAAPTILGAFPESLQRRAARDLERLGVELHLGARVTGVDARGIDTDSIEPGVRRIEAVTKIWAAGVEASPLARLVAEAAGARTDRAGRVHVRPDCTLPGHPEVFVIGDSMRLEELPGVAQVAIQSGRHAAATIARRLRGDTAERPFRYRDKGTMAAISRSRAIASIGPLRAWGFVAWLLWMGVHLYALTGFKNRVAVLLDWTVAFIGRGRPQRTITTQQVFARQVREAQAEAVSGAAAAFHAMAPAPARPAPGRSSGSSHEDQPDVAARDLATVCVRHELGLPPDHAVALGIDAGQAHAVGRERRPERSGERARAAVGHALRVPRAAGRQEHPPRALNGGQGRHAAVEHRLQVRAERDGVRHKVGPPGRGRAREVSAAAVADDRRTRGSDTPALLSAAAQRLEPLDPGLARETHLEALLASVRSGRFACIEGVVEAADGGDIRL